MIKFHFDEVRSTFISKCKVTFKIKSKFYEVNHFFDKIEIVQGVP